MLRTLLLFLLLVVLGAPARAAWSPRKADLKLYSEALIDLGSGRLEPAEAGFRKILAEDPTCGMCRHGLGVALLRAGKVKEAIAELERTAEEWPRQPEAWAALSAATFVAQDFPRSRAAAEAAIQADPGSIEAHAALQQALLRLGDLPAARKALQAARLELPDPVVACFEVQLAQEAGAPMPSGRLEACRRAGAPELVTDALSRSEEGGIGMMAGRLGSEPLLLTAQARDLWQSGDAALALKLLDDVLHRWPHRADARALRARIRREAGDREGARTDLEALLGAGSWVDVHRSGAMSGILRKSDEQRLVETIAEAAGLLVELLAEAGRLAEADQRLKDARALPPHPAIEAAAIRLLLARKEQAEAWKSADAALARFPVDPRVLQAVGALAIADPGGLSEAARKALSSSTDWRDPYNLAVALHKGGDATGCLEQARGLEAGDPKAGGLVAVLLHTCAVAAGDLAMADAALARIESPDAISASTRYNHALMRLQAGDVAGADKLVGRLPEQLLARPDSARDPAARALVALGIRTRVGTGAWAAAASLGGSSLAEDADRVWLAERLLDAGRPAEAARVLPGCESLAADLAARCTDVKAKSP